MRGQDFRSASSSSAGQRRPLRAPAHRGHLPHRLRCPDRRQSHRRSRDAAGHFRKPTRSRLPALHPPGRPSAPATPRRGLGAGDRQEIRRTAPRHARSGGSCFVLRWQAARRNGSGGCAAALPEGRGIRPCVTSANGWYPGRLCEQLVAPRARGCRPGACCQWLGGESGVSGEERGCPTRVLTCVCLRLVVADGAVWTNASTCSGGSLLWAGIRGSRRRCGSARSACWRGACAEGRAAPRCAVPLFG